MSSWEADEETQVLLAVVESYKRIEEKSVYRIEGMVSGVFHYVRVSARKEIQNRFFNRRPRAGPALFRQVGR